MEIANITTLADAWPLWLTVLSLIGTAIVNQPHWSANTKRFVTFLVTGFFALVYAIASNRLVGVPIPDVVQTIVVQFLIVGAILIAIGQAFYQLLKSPLTWVENKTAINGPDVVEGEVEPEEEVPASADEPAEAEPTVETSDPTTTS